MFMTQAELLDKAKEVVAAHGSQAAVAEKLGKTRAAVSQALNGADGTQKMLEKIVALDYEVTPYYKVVRRKQRPSA